MKSLSRRSFFNLFRAPADAPSAEVPAELLSAEASHSETEKSEDVPQSRGTFDIRDFYRQREILGVVGEAPPPIKSTTEVKVPTTNAGSMNRRQS